MEVYSWEHHRTKWWFVHQTMFDYHRVEVPEMIFGDLRVVWVCPLELGYPKCRKPRNYPYRTWHFLALFIVSLPIEYYRYIMIDLPSNPVVTGPIHCSQVQWTILREAKRKKRCLKRAEEVERLLEPLVVGGDGDAPDAPGPANSTAVSSGELFS